MSQERQLNAQDFDAVLPQTQCGLCGYNGCMPYAQAMADKKAAINLCPPGGLRSLKALAALTGTDPTPYIAEMQAKTKPRQLAVVREADCIGCKKCITACPVNAILGSGKQMHSVLIDYCTGCNLCIPPCPVDCIDLIDHPETDIFAIADQSREQYLRKKNQALEKKAEDPKPIPPINNKSRYLQAAIARGLAKRKSEREK